MAGFFEEPHTRYAEAMRHSGSAALAMLAIADRLADAERDAAAQMIVGTRPRTFPVLVGLGALLVRVGGRLEAAATPKPRCEYA